MSGSIDATQLRSRALALVAAAATPVEAERGRHLAGKAVRLAGEAPQGLDRVTALSHVAQALAGADDEWARTAAEQGVALAEGIRGLFSKGARRDALAVAAVGLAAVAPERAEKIATLVGGPRTLAEVAEAMAATAPARAERIARAIGEPTAAGRALADVAEAMAAPTPGVPNGSPVNSTRTRPTACSWPSSTPRPPRIPNAPPASHTDSKAASARPKWKG
ncbi:hypothetical protein ACFQ60_46525 [Streptomyces zhihengii]